jgi:imidazole glycerol-phosphate synthase subunit HisH
MDRVVVLDYGAGNLRSVVNALRHLGCRHSVSADPEEAARADRVVFPGVGGADAAMRELRRTGLDGALLEVYRSGRPLLGICLGSQIAFERSEEGDTACLGMLPGRVRLLPGRDASASRLKVPHMGWNAVRQLRAHPVFAGVPDGMPFYFVHSYYIEPAEPSVILATAEYGMSLPAVVGCRSFVATQFHLEKSGEPGLAMLASFLRWNGTWDAAACLTAGDASGGRAGCSSSD